MKDALGGGYIYYCLKCGSEERHIPSEAAEAMLSASRIDYSTKGKEER